MTTIDYSKAESWYKIPDITKEVDTFFVYPTEYKASNADDPLTRGFRGRTYCVYILSMCVQNLAEVVGYSARLPWFVTFLMMLAAGLAVPVLLCRWNEKHPLPGWLRAIVGL
jgi:hypothetical protein